jgi:hypothetical protein
MPMFSVDVYDRFGAVYEVERVVDANFSFNSTAYAEYSPLYMPATYVSVYCIAFALSTAAIVHTILYHGKSVVQKLKNVQTEPEDVHAKLMRNYPEVPDWWYAIYTLVCLGLAMVAIEARFIHGISTRQLKTNRSSTPACPSGHSSFLLALPSCTSFQAASFSP